MQTVFKTFLLATVATYINCDMPRYASAQSLTVPGTLAEDTSNFVLLSASGTTVSISGFSTDVQVIISSSTGLIRLGSTSGLTPATGYSDSLWLSGSGEIVFDTDSDVYAPLVIPQDILTEALTNGEKNLNFDGIYLLTNTP